MRQLRSTKKDNEIFEEKRWKEVGDGTKKRKGKGRRRKKW